MKIIDEAKIFVKAGDGGNGCVSFRREKFIDMGGPDGGNGGYGGNIIIVPNPHDNTLLKYRYKQHFEAESGKKGMGSNSTGRSGEDMILEVPMGTEILDEYGEEVLFDVKNLTDEFVIARGGKGGAGNACFKSSINQAPDKAIPGEDGEERWIWLKLKMISDVGIIGFPNAGKSTLLSVLTSAKPKIADYPFTTLSPNLGVVFTGYKEFVIADIPGLIEGAHEGLGLGDKFLKHIERCKILLHLIDVNSEDIIEDYDIIRNELDMYSEELAIKDEYIAINKCDSVDEEFAAEQKKLLEEHTGKKVICVSAVSRYNLQELVNILAGAINL